MADRRRPYSSSSRCPHHSSCGKISRSLISSNSPGAWSDGPRCQWPFWLVYPLPVAGGRWQVAGRRTQDASRNVSRFTFYVLRFTFYAALILLILEALPMLYPTTCKEEPFPTINTVHAYERNYWVGRRRSRRELFPARPCSKRPK